MKFQRKQQMQQVKLYQQRLPNAKVLPQDDWVVEFAPPPPPPPPKEPAIVVGSVWKTDVIKSVTLYKVVEVRPVTHSVRVEWFSKQYNRVLDAWCTFADFDDKFGIFKPFTMDNE